MSFLVGEIIFNVYEATFGAQRWLVKFTHLFYVFVIPSLTHRLK